MTKDELEYVRSTVDSEGFEYAFRSYSYFERIKDAKFHKLLDKYKAAADALQNYIDKVERSL